MEGGGGRKERRRRRRRRQEDIGQLQLFRLTRNSTPNLDQNAIFFLVIFFFFSVLSIICTR